MGFRVLLADTNKEMLRKLQTSFNWVSLNPAQILLAQSGIAVKESCVREAFDLILCNSSLFQHNMEHYLYWLSQKSESAGILLYGEERSTVEYRMMMQYGVFDYITYSEHSFFPELWKSVETIYRHRKLEERENYLEQEWQERKESRLLEYFRYNLREERSYEKSEHEEILQKFHIRLKPDSHYVLTLVTGKQIPVDEWRNKETLRQYIGWIFQMSEAQVTVTEMDLGKYLVLFEIQRRESKELMYIRELALQLLHNAKEYSGFDLNCYISEVLQLWELPVMLHKLIQRDRENVSYVKKIFLVGKGETKKTFANTAKEEPHFIENWLVLLESGQAEAFCRRVELGLHHQILSGNMNLQNLSTLFHNVMQTFYLFLNGQEVNISKLVEMPEWDAYYGKALDSTEDFLEFLHYAASKVISCKQKEALEPIDQILAWLERHFTEDCSRGMLAGMVSLHESYFSRMFHEKTGMSPTVYIRKKRIDLAKELLKSRNLSIGEVGIRCGYDSATRFTENFQKEMGMTPGEYRKKSEESHKTN